MRVSIGHIFSLFLAICFSAALLFRSQWEIAYRFLNKKTRERISASPSYPSFGVRVPQGYSVIGIDVSKYQQEIDWKKVSEMEDGGKRIQFAYIRSSMGEKRSDERFEENWKGSGAAGLLRGAYHYFDAREDALKQARNFIHQIEKVGGVGELPPVVDVEVNYHLSNQALQDAVGLFISEVEKAFGVRMLLYTGANFYKAHLAAKFPNIPLWIAHYQVSKPATDVYSWQFWQFTEKGRVNGIRENVDLNVFQGSWNELKQFRRSQGLMN